MRVGITGHQQREGIDWLWVQREIALFLNGAVNLEGYSSLAKGSDQVFANCVLDRGGSLVAVIPIADYENSLHGEDLDTFKNLLSRATRVDLDARVAPQVAFLRAGEWITRKVDVMIAVWDGNAAVGRGGTADIVRYAKSVNRRVHHINPITRVVTELRG